MSNFTPTPSTGPTRTASACDTLPRCSPLGSIWYQTRRCPPCPPVHQPRAHRSPMRIFQVTPSRTVTANQRRRAQRALPAVLHNDFTRTRHGRPPPTRWGRPLVPPRRRPRPPLRAAHRGAGALRRGAGALTARRLSPVRDPPLRGEQFEQVPPLMRRRHRRDLLPGRPEEWLWPARRAPSAHHRAGYASRA